MWIFQILQEEIEHFANHISGAWERTLNSATSYYTIKIFQCSLDSLAPHVQLCSGLEVDLIYKPLKHDALNNENLY